MTTTTKTTTTKRESFRVLVDSCVYNCRINDISLQAWKSNIGRYRLQVSDDDSRHAMSDAHGDKAISHFNSEKDMNDYIESFVIDRGHYEYNDCNALHAYLTVHLWQTDGEC